MRVLCSVIGSPSHARAMRPFVSVLTAAGHEVLVAVPSSLAAVFADTPVRVADVYPDMAEQMVRGLREGRMPFPQDQDPAAMDPKVMGALMGAGPHLVDNYRQLLSLAREFRPQLILRDGAELGACLVGDTIGVPYLSVPSGAGNVLEPAQVLPLLNERRSELGLPVADDPAGLHRYGRIDCMPSQYSFTPYQVPKTFTYRQPAMVEAGETLPAWLADLPADRPLVIAAIGTALPMANQFQGTTGMELSPEMARMFDPSAFLRPIVAGLAGLDCVAVVSTGGIPLDDQVVGDNVHLVDHFPQPLLLQCAQLFVTHGGYNSIRESIGAGVPMAVLPQFGDQPVNADRVQELGIGRRVQDGNDIAATCQSLLDDPGIAANARRAQRHMLALPPVAAAVPDLERLGTTAA